MKRFLSIVLACVLVISLAGISFASSEPRMEVKRDAAREVFELVNKEREKQGYAPLVWVEELYQPAVTRAKELYETFSHTRPDGSSWSTVSSISHGENISWNRLTPVSVMDQWMGSGGHRSNILGESYNFKGIAVACVDTDKGPYWVQLFTLRVPEEGETIKETAQDTTKKATVVGADDKKEKTVVGGSPIKEAEGSPAVTTTTPTTADKTSNQAIIKKLNELAPKTTGIISPVFSAENVELTPAVLKELNQWEKENGRTVAISYDTYVPKTARVQGRMTVLPSRLTEQKENLTVEVFNESANVTRVKKLFGGWFDNDLEVLEINHGGKLSGYLDIAARIRLVDLNTDSLVFYTYNAKENTYSLQENLKYTIDNNGYVHFTTNGDYVIVTDKKLA